ncbi:MAG: lipopolysaccharide kinase InaA family protein [Bacteroidota bacterium]
MKESFSVHPSYAQRTEQIQQMVHHFHTTGEMVVDGDRNVIKKMRIEGEYFNIKKFKTPNFFQGLVYQLLRKSKAQRSFEYAQKLIGFGLKTPFPIAYFEQTGFGLKESYYVSKHLEYDFDFRVLNHNPKWPNRDEILKQFAAFTFQLHENGINFLDHSPGNTLIKDLGEGNYDFYLIDLNRMRFESMDFNKRMRNFRRMWLSKTMINVMAPIYAELYGTTSEETHQLMTKFSAQFQKKVNLKKLRRQRKRNA